MLFLDELNRSEHSVQQELMNLVLNREINGFELPDNVYVMAAGNPSSKYDNFKNTDYQVVDMDQAQEDRFVWLFMESDPKTWIDWGSRETDEDETIIHESVLEFIATNPEFLNDPDSKEDIKPSPRSWERISNIYKTYLKNKKNYPKNILFNLVKGNVGSSIAISFTQFLNDSSNPLLRPEEIFAEKELSSRLIEIIERETMPRQLVIIKNCVRYMEKKKRLTSELDIFTKIMTIIPKDLMVMEMMDLVNNHYNLHKKLVKLDNYLDAFHDTDQLVD